MNYLAGGGAGGKRAFPRKKIEREGSSLKWKKWEHGEEKTAWTQKRSFRTKDG